MTRLKSITELHRFNNIAPPNHPLISLIDYSDETNAHRQQIEVDSRVLYHFNQAKCGW
jgi:hypothetical protein